MWGRSCGVRAFRVAVLPSHCLSTQKDRERQRSVDEGPEGQLGQLQPLRAEPGYCMAVRPVVICVSHLSLRRPAWLGCCRGAPLCSWETSPNCPHPSDASPGNASPRSRASEAGSRFAQVSRAWRFGRQCTCGEQPVNKLHKQAAPLPPRPRSGGPFDRRSGTGFSSMSGRLSGPQEELLRDATHHDVPVRRKARTAHDSGIILPSGCDILRPPRLVRQ